MWRGSWWDPKFNFVDVKDAAVKDGSTGLGFRKGERRVQKAFRWHNED